MSSYAPASTAAAPATDAAPASRKRSRDIHGIQRFREVVYGEKGIARLHAMATRNPVLMYPPDGVAEARALQQQQQQQQRQQEEDEQGSSDAAVRVCDENVDDAHASSSCVVAATTPYDVAAATYHHKQLDALLRMVYEFNHATFVKLTMHDTLRLLARCGREAVAHLSEQEMHLRLAHDARLREVCAQHAAADAAHARQAHDAAERVRRELDDVIAATAGVAAEHGDEDGAHHSDDNDEGDDDTA